MMSFKIDRIARAAAKPFIERLHYSRRCPGGHHTFFGAYLEDGSLYAVAAYGIGANPGSAAVFARMTGLPVTKRNMVELTRVCREGERGAALIPMSAFLARCHAELRRDGFGPATGGPMRFVVSYSDPAHSHDGGLYRAANFRHMGEGKRERQFKDPAGNFVHARKPHNVMTRGNEHDLIGLDQMHTADAVREMGLTSFRTVPKDRWFIDLGKPLKAHAAVQCCKSCCTVPTPPRDITPLRSRAAMSAAIADTYSCSLGRVAVANVDVDRLGRRRE